MYEYSSILVFFSLLILLSCYKFEKIFYTFSVAYPILLLPLLEQGLVLESLAINFAPLTLGSPVEAAFVFAFSIVASAANALSSGKKLIPIFGGLYLIAGIECLFAKDLLMCYIFLEFMMLCACALFCTEGTKEGLAAAKQYFLTHLSSGALFLIAICYMTASGQSIEIGNIRDLIEQNDIAATVLLVACLINIGAVPFSFWITNCYPKANYGSFLYLTCFTTKISLIVLIKLFHGLEILKYYAIAMIIYGGFLAIFESNLKKLFCYFAILQSGALLLFAASCAKEVPIFMYYMIANHVLYNCLFAVIILESPRTINCTDLGYIKQPFLLFCLLIAIMLGANFPLTANFIYKQTLATDILDSTIYYTLILSNFLFVAALPIKEYFGATRIKTRVSKSHMIVFIALTLFLILINIGAANKYGAIVDTYYIKLCMQQVFLIVTALIFAKFVPIKRGTLRKIYFFSRLQQKLTKAISIVVKEKNTDSIDIMLLFSSTLNKVKSIHNQQTSIILVFCFLTLMILAFNVS